MLANKIALAIALGAAVIGSQGPEFAQQYRQRAGGALDELKWSVALFDAETASEGLTRSAGIKRLEADGEPLAQKRGQDMEQTIARSDRLEAQLAAMETAGPLKRLTLMATEIDPVIAGRTLHAFELATPLTVEALMTAGAAGLLGWAATYIVAWPLRRRFRPRAQAAATA